MYRLRNIGGGGINIQVGIGGRIWREYQHQQSRRRGAVITDIKGWVSHWQAHKDRGLGNVTSDTRVHVEMRVNRIVWVDQLQPGNLEAGSERLTYFHHRVTEVCSCRFCRRSQGLRLRDPLRDRFRRPGGGATFHHGVQIEERVDGGI